MRFNILNALKWGNPEEVHLKTRLTVVCQDNNKSPEAMVGTGDSVSRTSPIVP